MAPRRASNSRIALSPGASFPVLLSWGIELVPSRSTRNWNKKYKEGLIVCVGFCISIECVVYTRLSIGIIWALFMLMGSHRKSDGNMSIPSRHITQYWRCYYVKTTPFWRYYVKMASFWRYIDFIIVIAHFRGCPTKPWLNIQWGFSRVRISNFTVLLWSWLNGIV